MERSKADPILECVYRVVGADGTTAGAAFAIGPAGLFVTCTHVLESAGVSARVELVRQSTGISVQATVQKRACRSSDQEDVSFLRLDGSPPSDWTYLQLASHEPKPGLELFSFGFPQGKREDGTPGSARVLGNAREGAHPIIAIASGEVSVGFSGAPAVDLESGLVVGMVVSIGMVDAYGKGQDSAYLVPAATLARLHTGAVIGVDRAVRAFCEAMGTRVLRTDYWIAGLSNRQTIPFVTPALTEVFERPDAPAAQQPLALAEWLRTYAVSGANPVCLVGDAGSGKSAILRAIATELITSGTALPVLVSAQALANAAGIDFSARLFEALRSSSDFGGEMSLHPDFFTAWSQRLGHRFVILVDGVDEIVGHREREAFIAMLGRELAPFLRAGGHSLVVASREVSELDELAKTFRKIRVEPLPQLSQEKLIKLVLGPRAPEFECALGRMTNPSLAASPFVMQLLLALFLSDRLAETPSLITLYDAYLDEIADQWRKQGLPRTARMSDFAIEILALLAWSDMSGRFDLEQASIMVGEFLMRELNLGAFAAERVTREFLNFFRRQGAIVRDIRDHWIEWTHLNFRDYLAAVALCRLECAIPGLEDSQIDELQQQVLSGCWEDAGRETFARYVLIMSRRRQAIEAHAATHMGSEGFLCFLSRAIADGASLPEMLLDRAAARLLTVAAENGTCVYVFIGDRDNPLIAYNNVLWREPFFSRAHALLRWPPETLDERNADLQRRIAAAVKARCTASQFKAITRDKSIHQDLRAVVKSGNTKIVEV